MGSTSSPVYSGVSLKTQVTAKSLLEDNIMSVLLFVITISDSFGAT